MFANNMAGSTANGTYTATHTLTYNTGGSGYGGNYTANSGLLGGAASTSSTTTTVPSGGGGGGGGGGGYHPTTTSPPTTEAPTTTLPTSSTAPSSSTTLPSSTTSSTASSSTTETSTTLSTSTTETSTTLTTSTVAGSTTLPAGTDTTQPPTQTVPTQTGTTPEPGQPQDTLTKEEGRGGSGRAASGTGGYQVSNATAVLSCSDGTRNQGETGVDCGGLCPPCRVLNLTFQLSSRSFVEPGETFRVEAHLAANKQASGVNVSIQLPKEFTAYPRGVMTLGFDESSPQTVWWNIQVPSNASERLYTFIFRVVDQDGKVMSEEVSEVTVVRPLRMPVLGLDVDIPDVRVVQDRSFMLVRSVFVVIYSQKSLILSSILALAGLGYVYYSIRRRQRIES
jgi:hypothetical protein